MVTQSYACRAMIITTKSQLYIRFRVGRTVFFTMCTFAAAVEVFVAVTLTSCTLTSNL